MANIVKEFMIDCTKPNRFRTTIAKQGDMNSRFIKATIASDGEPISIESAARVAINAKRSDGEISTFAGSVNEDGTVLVPIANWMLAKEGHLDCEIVIVLASTEEKLSTTRFTIDVEGYITDGSEIEDDDDYDFLLELIGDVETALENANTAVTKSQTATSGANTAAASARSAASAATNAAQSASNAASSALRAAADANEISTLLNQRVESDYYRGDKGEQGVNGKSAYEIAVEHGYQGTEEEWLEYIKSIKQIDEETIVVDNLTDGLYITKQTARVQYNGRYWELNPGQKDYITISENSIFYINTQFKMYEDIGTTLIAFGGTDVSSLPVYLNCAKMSMIEYLTWGNIRKKVEQNVGNPVSSGAVYAALTALKQELEKNITIIDANGKKKIRIVKTDTQGVTTEYTSEEYNSDDVVSGITGVVIDEVNNDTSETNDITTKLTIYAEDENFQKASKTSSGKIYFRCLDDGDYTLTFGESVDKRTCKKDDFIVALCDFVYSLETGEVISYTLSILSVLSFLNNDGTYLTKTETEGLISKIEQPKKLSDIVDDDGKTALDEVNELLDAKNINYDDSKTYYDCKNLQDLMDKLAFDLGYRIVEQDGTPARIVEAVDGGVAPYTFALGDIINVPKYVGTARETTVPFRVVDFDNAELLDETVRHSMTLMSRYLVTSMAFDSAEATYFAEEAMPAGNYYFKYNSNTYLSFTTTQAIPAGGLFRYIYAGSGGADGTITTYSSCMRDENGDLQTIETGLTCTVGQTGTECTPVNILDRVRYGCNRYLYSDARKFLNSEREASTHSWQPDVGRTWCLEPAWSLTVDGFLYGIPSEWLGIFAYHKTTVAKSGTDGGGFEKVVERVSLPTVTQMYGGNNNGIAEGVALKYYADNSTLSAPSTAADSFRRQYSTSGSASAVWLSSPNAGSAYAPWFLIYTGGLGYGNSAAGSCGFVPLVTIAKINQQ